MYYGEAYKKEFNSENWICDDCYTRREIRSFHDKSDLDAHDDHLRKFEKNCSVKLKSPEEVNDPPSWKHGTSVRSKQGPNFGLKSTILPISYLSFQDNYQNVDFTQKLSCIPRRDNSRRNEFSHNFSPTTRQAPKLSNETRGKKVLKSILKSSTCYKEEPTDLNKPRKRVRFHLDIENSARSVRPRETSDRGECSHGDNSNDHFHNDQRFNAKSRENVKPRLLHQQPRQPWSPPPPSPPSPRPWRKLPLPPPSRSWPRHFHLETENDARSVRSRRESYRAGSSNDHFRNDRVVTKSREKAKFPSLPSPPSQLPPPPQPSSTPPSFITSSHDDIESNTYASGIDSVETKLLVNNPKVRLYLQHCPGKNIAWNGGLKFSSSEKLKDFRAFHAKPACNILRKALHLSNNLPSVLEIRPLSLCNVEEVFYEDGFFDFNDIALYFFPDEDVNGSKEDYARLFELMERKNLQLVSCVDGAKLLIFTSKKLPQDSQNAMAMVKKGVFLWGIFLDTKKVSPVVQQKSQPQSSVQQVSSHGSASHNQSVSPQEMDKKMKHLDRKNKICCSEGAR
ncbi:hypothetical protein ACFE04_026910 [Oxalis oulophora]